MTRAAVVSATGTGAKRTIPALADSSEVTVTALHGRDVDRLGQLASQFSISDVYTNIDELVMDAEVDIAVVCSPPFLHLEQITALLRAGIPCLVEKPLAITTLDARAIADLARDTGVQVTVAHHLRFAPILDTVRGLISAGSLGEPLAASMEWSFELNRSSRNAAWKLDPELNGGSCVSDAGSHCLDIAVHLFGPGHLRSAVSTPIADSIVADEVVSVVDHGGVLVRTTASWRYGPFSNALQISCTEGEVVVPGFFSESPATDGFVYRKGARQRVTAPTANLYRLEVEDFAKETSMSGWPATGASVDDAVHVVTLIEAINSAMLVPSSGRVSESGQAESRWHGTQRPNQGG